MFGAETGIYTNPRADWEKPVSVETFDGQGETYFATNCGVEIHGALSQDPDRTKKHSFRLHFKPGYGNAELDYPLFAEAGDDTIETVVLRAGFQDSWAMEANPVAYRETYLNDRWAAETQAEMGGLAPHGTWVHLYVNGFYWGLYNPVERPREDFAASYLGGAKEDYDIVKHGDGVVAGTEDAWDHLFEFDGLLDAVDRDPHNRVAYEAVAAVLDIPDFVDYMLVNQFGGNTDWPLNNWYASRRREEGAKWRFHSWDAECALSRDYQNKVTRQPGPAGIVYNALKKVEEFQVLFADHIHRHMHNGGVLSVDANAARITAMHDEIYEAMVGESARWGDGSEGLDPHNPPLWTRDDKWDAELWSGDAEPEKNALVGDKDYPEGESYFELRGAYDPEQEPEKETSVIWQYRNVGLYPAVEPAAFSQHGGNVSGGFQLSMTADAGTIYYTLDGSDPRQYWTGAVQGTEYTAPITLNGSVIVNARVLHGGEWSALTEAAFAVDHVALAHDLVITELNYHPYDPTPEELAAQSPLEPDLVVSDFEFIELANTSDVKTIDLTRMKFTEGIFFSFSLSDTTELQPGESLVLVADTEAFAARYGPDVPIAGVFQGDLDDAGEVLTLTDRDGQTVLSFAYADWFAQADGNGSALELIDPAAVPPNDPPNDPVRTNYLQDASHWRSTWAYGGTPGNLQVLIWDELGDGDWNYIDPGTGHSRWRWVDSPDDPTSVVPNKFKHAVVTTDQINVTADASVRGSRVESGQLAVAEGATLTVDGVLEMGSGSLLVVQLDPANGMHGRVEGSGSVTLTGSELTLEAVSNYLSSPVEPGYGDKSDITIIEMDSAQGGVIEGEFANYPPGKDVTDPDPLTPLHPHLGHGVFLGKSSTDPAEPGEGVFYRPDPEGDPEVTVQVDIHVWQGAPGDLNGDWKVDFDDIWGIVEGGQYDEGPGPLVDWTTGNFDDDDDVDFDDIWAISQTGLYDTGNYYEPPERGGEGGAAQSEALLGIFGEMLGESVLTVIYDSATGNLYIDNPLEDLTGINFESESGIFTDAEEADLWWNAMFTDLDEGAIGSAVFGSFFTGDCDLGAVATAGLDESFLLNDLTLTYTRAGITGSLLATLVVI